VGAHTCKALRRSGYTPVVFDNLSTGHESFVQWGPFVHGDASQLFVFRSTLCYRGTEIIWTVSRRKSVPSLDELDVVPSTLELAPDEIELALATNGKSLCERLAMALIVAMIVETRWPQHNASVHFNS
jgi:hypothetical protein